MTTYTSFDLVEFSQPLVERTRLLSAPEGRQVLLQVQAVGVCHSDLHILQGGFDLGAEGWFNMADRGMVLPVTLGHEIVGEVAAVGSEVDEVEVGSMMLVFPWVGCRLCRACEERRESECLAMRIIGLIQDGGYATHIVVEDPRYLVNVDGLDPVTIAPYACAGLTVFNALTKVGPLAEGEWLAVMGAGGLGLNGLAIAGALGFQRIVVTDIDEAKLAAALNMGADAVVDATAADAQQQLADITGGRLLGVLDTVGAPGTARLGVHTLSKTGRYLVVGQAGGDFSMPQVWLPQRSLTVQGSHSGDYGQLGELIDLVRTGRVTPVPIDERPLSGINGALADLQAGRVVGRLVVTVN